MVVVTAVANGGKRADWEGGVGAAWDGWEVGDMATFEFDYDPEEALAHLVMTGCLPEQRSHQYYPTPASVAEEAVDLAEIRPHDKILPTYKEIQC